MRNLLDELERLEKAATPGPWATRPNRVYSKLSRPHPSDQHNLVGPPRGLHHQFVQEADAALIAAARNALPALLRVARASQEVARRTDRRVPWAWLVELDEALAALTTTNEASL